MISTQASTNSGKFKENNFQVFFDEEQPKKQINIEEKQQQQDKVLQKPKTIQYNNNNKKKELIIGEKHQAPNWLIDNEHLLSGYRINFHSHKHIWQSIFMFHNDTINIWTHALGAIIALILLGFELNNSWYSEAVLTKFPVHLVLIAYVGMFSGSSYLHIYFCHSQSKNRCVLKADYCGIAQLGASKGVAFIYYGLYCSGIWNKIYLGIWVTLWTIIFFMSMTNKFHDHKYKSYKIAIYVIAGSFIVIPMAHILILGQQGNYSPTVPFLFLVGYLTALVLGVGLTFVLQFPEKYFKYKFDYIGASHQLWHICVIIDFLLTYYGTYANYAERLNQLECS